jgi:DNA-binding NtrC family response regulator
MINAPSVLLVEENPQVLETLARALFGEGYSVTPVRHPRQALAAAAKRKYHIAIISDILPEQRGVELMRTLQLRVADLDVVLVSQQPDADYTEEALALGAYATLPEPCLATLLRILNQAVSERADFQWSDESPLIHSAELAYVG